LTSMLELLKSNQSPLAALGPYMMPQFAQVIFVDRENGSNAQSGEDWDNAVKDFNSALDKIWGGSDTKARGRHYAIIYQCRTTSGQKFTTEQIIDMEGIHIFGAGWLYGLGGGQDSCFVAGPSTGYADKTAIKFTKSGCSIQGIKFYMPSENALGSEEYFIHATNPIGFAVDSCQFVAPNANGVMTGMYGGAILIEGAESPVITNNQMLYCYRGIKGMAWTSRYFHKAIIEKNKMYGCDVGILFGDGFSLENAVEENTILNKSMYGYEMTAGIKLTTSGGNAFRRNFVGHATKTTAYTKGSGTNYWNLNYYDAGSGGTLYDGS
jgi:hypothetical protein